MPADTLTISLTGPLADDLRAAAAACDLSVEDYVRLALSAEARRASEALGWDRDESWEKDVAALEEYDRTGVAAAWEEVEAWMKSWGTDSELPPPKPRKLK
jgi:hypothetical protein